MSGVLSGVEASIPALRRYAFALLRGRQDADDLVHDTLVRALDRLHTCRAESDVRPWLFAIMHNLFVSGALRARRRQEVPVEESAEADTARHQEPAQESAVHWNEVVRALEHLPDEQRAVILLVTVEDLSYAEAADVLGVPIGTVMSRLSRGREALRRLLAEREAVRPNLRRVK